ncbi:MAG: CRTAC1 family protein [Verrucomicrobiae bacterium]|nr:CRTAC1 family protein [Verrucomicrobiae bacterium]
MLISVLALASTACRAAAQIPPPLPPVSAGVNDRFIDVTRQAGIGFTHQFCHDGIMNILLSNGAGGAVFDYDNDGFVDLYLLNWGPLDGVTKRGLKVAREPNRLYRNRGDGTFEDVTARAGVAGTGFASAAATGDYDNDGFEDLYVACFGANQLLRNRGDGTFDDVTTQAGVADANGTGISATFLDADGDGSLDLYVANYLTFDPSTISEQNPGAYPGPLAYPGEADVLFRNRGDGTFEPITQNAGLYAPKHRGMSVSAFDCDRDGDPDLYVSNDDTPNGLWLNDGKGQFHDAGLELGVALNSIGEAPGSMNATLADANNDGWLDLFVTRFGYGSLYVRQEGGHYLDEMWRSGLGRLTQNHVGWGGSFIDFDNDGDPDLFIVNGSAFTLGGTLSLLLENDGEGRFSDAGKEGGAFFATPIDGRGSAVLDFDNDGRLDLLATTLANRPFLLRNRGEQGSRNHWLKLDVRDRHGRVAYGALITVEGGGRTWNTEVLCPTGFLMQGDTRVHLGLGSASKVDRLEIRWPGGGTRTLHDVAVDQILKLREPNP